MIGECMTTTCRLWARQVAIMSFLSWRLHVGSTVEHGAGLLERSEQCLHKEVLQMQISIRRRCCQIARAKSQKLIRGEET